MKKHLSVILIFCLIFCFSGCSDLKNILSSSNTSAPQSQNVTAKPDTTSSETSSLIESEVSSTQSEEESVPSVIEKPTSFDVTLSFVGDVMLANSDTMTKKGSFYEFAENNPPEYFLEKVQSVFAKDDFTIVNLENVLTDNELEKSEKDHDPAYWFRSPTSFAEMLTKGSVEGVSLANNHIYDYGKQGYKDTTAAVKAAGLYYGNFGEIMYLEKQGFKIAVICYGMWRPNGVGTVKNLIKKAGENSDYQIVFFHGGQERIFAPEEWKIEACHELVDAGADLVIGNHPHVLQPREIYNDTEIIYSLGNFLFGGNKKPGKNTIIYQMKLTISVKTLKVKGEKSKIIPCYVYDDVWNNYQPCLIKDKAEKQQVLDFMNGKAKSPYLN